jgi:RHS repeat-associated protein
MTNAGGTSVISQRLGSNSVFYLFDAIGNTDRLANSSAVITDEYSYHAFGTMNYSIGATANRYRFVGQSGYYFDIDQNTYYLRMRHLRPLQQAFLSRDPIGAVDTPNLLLYVGNNPINLIDPWGLCYVCSVKLIDAGFVDANDAVFDKERPHHSGALRWRNNHQEVINKAGLEFFENGNPGTPFPPSDYYRSYRKYAAWQKPGKPKWMFVTQLFAIIIDVCEDNGGACKLQLTENHTIRKKIAAKDNWLEQKIDDKVVYKLQAVPYWSATEPRAICKAKLRGPANWVVGNEAVCTTRIVVTDSPALMDSGDAAERQLEVFQRLFVTDETKYMSFILHNFILSAKTTDGAIVPGFASNGLVSRLNLPYVKGAETSLPPPSK